MTDRCDRCVVAGVPCHDCRLRALERAERVLEAAEPGGASSFSIATARHLATDLIAALDYIQALPAADGAVFLVACNACGKRRDWHAYADPPLRPDFCNACSSTDVEVTQFRVQLAVGKGIEPTGRLRVVESENARLRYALRVIADQGDPHNGEVTRRRKDGEPESWASRLAYFTLHPERRRCD